MKPVNVDIVNKWLTALSSIAVVAGVVVATIQLSSLADQNTAQARAASTDTLFRLRTNLDDHAYARITAVIQDNASNTPVLANSRSRGKFTDSQIADYIGNFEDIGILVNDDVLIKKMAYHEFSNEVEKTWCNLDVQKVIADARSSDRSITRQSDPFYGNFESLARAFLVMDGETCPDLDKQ